MLPASLFGQLLLCLYAGVEASRIGIYTALKNFNIGYEKEGSENTMHVVNMKKLQASPPYLIRKRYSPCKTYFITKNSNADETSWVNFIWFCSIFIPVHLWASTAMGSSVLALPFRNMWYAWGVATHDHAALQWVEIAHWPKENWKYQAI